VVGEAEPQAVTGELAPLGRPRCRGLDDLEIAGKQVIDRLGVGEASETEALAQRLKGGGVLGGSQVEVTAEEQRRVAGPLSRRLGGAQYIGRGEVRPVIGRVQVGEAEVGTRTERDASERHRPPLRPPGVDRQLPPLQDSFPPGRLLRFTAR
jgi:hypothetical protein